MRRFSLFILLYIFFFSLQGMAQKPSYKDMMYNSQYNVNEVIEAAEAHFATHDKGQGSGFKGYMRWRNLVEPMFFPSGDRSNFDPAQLYNEMKRVRLEQMGQRTSAAPGEHWRDMGPSYANNLLSPSYASGVGRIETVWAGFATSDTIFLGARNGGFWKTVDGGTSWRSTTQDLPAVGVVDLEVNPDAHNEVWIVTRHATGYSLGLMYSSDFGDTWNTTSLSFGNNTEQLYDMTIVETDPDTMYLSGEDGFYRSVDGGTNWNLILTGRVRSYALDPANSQHVYLVKHSNRNEVIISYDGGLTWPDSTTVSGNGNSAPRLCTSPNLPSVVYFASNNGIWKSTDFAQNFTNQGNTPASLMTFGVSDTDHNLCIFGSLDQFISTDGGQNWTLFGPWVNATAPNYLHADGRVVRSWNGTLFLGTDGYLGRSTDNGNTWNQVNNSGTGVREFYRIGTSETRTDMVVGGSQDNGTSILYDSTWYEWFGGDGMDCHINWTMPEIWYGNWQYGGMRRTNDFGSSIQGIKPNTGNGDWVTPTVLDRLNESTLFAGFDTLFKSTNHGDSWTALEDFSFLGNLKLLAIAPSDSNYLYTARNSRMFASNDNGLNWTEITTGLPSQSITRIAVHPRDPLRVVTTHSGFNSSNKVFESLDGGSTWTNISSGLPNLPVQAAAWQDSWLDRLFIGQDGGVWYRDSLNLNWVQYSDSLPVQPIRDLEILHGANTIRAGIFGRGVFEAPLPDAASAPRIVRIEIDPAVNTFNKPSNLDSVHIKAVVRSPDPLSQVNLYWGLDGVNFPNMLPMGLLSNDTFRTTTAIPPHSPGQQVYFRVRAEDVDADTARTDRIVYRVKEAILCDASGSIGTGSDYIVKVVLNTISQNSGQTYYANYYPSVQTKLNRNSSYPIEITLNTYFNCDSVFAWIDWNNDLSFEPSEQIIMSGPSAFNTTTGTVLVPANAVLDTVVMRVRNIYDCPSPTANPCGNAFGEVEDYGIIIEEELVNVADPSQAVVLVYPNPTTGQINLEFNAAHSPVRVYDAIGKLIGVFGGEGGAETLRIDLGDIAPGIYYLKARVDGAEWNGKVVVED